MSLANVLVPSAFGVLVMKLASVPEELVNKVMQRSLRSFQRNNHPLKINNSTDIRKTYHYQNYTAFARKADMIAKDAKWPEVVMLAFVDYCSFQVVKRKLIRNGIGSLLQDAFLAECKMKFERARAELVSSKAAIMKSIANLHKEHMNSKIKGLPLDRYLTSPAVGLANITKLCRNGGIDELTIACHKVCRFAVRTVRSRDAIQAKMLPSEQILDSAVSKAKQRLGQQLLIELFGDQLYTGA